jgi:hypothetical protein
VVNKSQLKGDKMSLTSKQVDAITHAWLDCRAASNLPNDHTIDLDGLAEAAGNSAEDLEKVFPWLLEDMLDGMIEVNGELRKDCAALHHDD